MKLRLKCECNAPTAKLVDNRPHFATICGNLLLLLLHLLNSLAAGNLVPLHMIKSNETCQPCHALRKLPPSPPPPLPLPLSSPFHFQLANGQFNAFSASFSLCIFQFISSFSFFSVLFFCFCGSVFSLAFFYLLLRTSRKNFRCMHNLQLHFLTLTQT